MSKKASDPVLGVPHNRQLFGGRGNDFQNKESKQKIIDGPLAFYEKPFPNSLWSRTVASFLFMALLFTLHIGASLLEKGVTINAVFDDFSLFLALLNGVGLFLLYSATVKLREFFTKIIKFSEPKNDKSETIFRALYEKEFLGKNIWLFGLTVGILNAVAGYVFGLSYLENKQYFLAASFILQTFLIGFIGGITINGLRVVLKSIRNFSLDLSKSLDYFYPDHCAGTLIIGNILFLFAIHFAAIGILIFVFVHRFEWQNQHHHLVELFIVVWKLTPFILSGIIFFVPAQKINSILRNYKHEEQRRIREKMNQIAQMIINRQPDADSATAIENLDKHYQKLKEIDEMVGQMNTWPYNLQYRAVFLSVFLPGFAGVIIETSMGFLLSALHIHKPD